jgi:D-glycero-alpha-D-manno-heptose-7-phosphate kinase
LARAHHGVAPTRIDLAGGTIDIWPLYLFHEGAQTLNAAISLRAHAPSTRATTTASPSCRRHRRTVEPTRAALRDRGSAPARAARCTSSGARLTLTTRGESPAGAGIAGSSALNIAVCGALAAWTRRGAEPEAC